MSCSCGNAVMRQHEAVSRLDGISYTLSFAECTSCGRVAGEFLRKSGVIIDRDTDARRSFQHLRTDGTHPYNRVPDHDSTDTPFNQPSDPVTDELADLLPHSEYRPYKTWFTPDGHAVQIILIWIEPATAVVAAPHLQLIERGRCLIDTSARLSRAIKHRLGICGDLAQTCSQPFAIHWGATEPQGPSAEDAPAPKIATDQNEAIEASKKGEQLSLF